jgi:D-3-phosphoglycerate dehydrogenase
MKKTLHLDSNHPNMIADLAALGFQNDIDFASSKSEVEKKIFNYHGIVIRSRFQIDKKFIDAATNLEFIARVGSGLESIDCEYAASKNIKLISSPEGNANAVGEHAIGMLLSIFNNLNQANSDIRNGNWNRDANRGVALEGKTVGIIGYGNMGKSFAKKLRGFDCEVIFYDIKPNLSDQNAKQVSLQELQQKADIVSLHTPWDKSTDKMIDAIFIAAMQKSFWIINTARGNSVVTADLVDGLKSGKVLGAGLDVLEYENLSFENLFVNNKIPEPLEYLMSVKNVLLSPHIAGWTNESHVKLSSVIVEKIKSLYFHDDKKAKEITKVTGIGGIFFKAENPKSLKAWYAKHLGLAVDNYGSTFWWKDKNGNDCSTQWSPLEHHTTYFEPSQKQFMQNFRVENLERLLLELKQENIRIIGEMQVFEYGKFAYIMDIEGNKIELWEPIDSAFQ